VFDFWLLFIQNEKGLSLSKNEKQKATMRAVLCFLYLKCGNKEKGIKLSLELPHTRESREVIYPLVSKEMSEDEISKEIRFLIFGE